MIDVRVRQDDRIELARLAAELLILDPRLGPVPLKESAVEKNAEIVGFEEVLAAGEFAGSTEDGDLHGIIKVWSTSRTIVECARQIRTSAGTSRATSGMASINRSTILRGVQPSRRAA